MCLPPVPVSPPLLRSIPAPRAPAPVAVGATAMATTRATAMAAALLALLVLLVAPGPAGAAELRVLFDGETGTARVAEGTGTELELAIGDNLRVEAVGLAPGRAVDLELVDDEGRLVARWSAVAGRQGRTGGALLWRRTGVVGCGPCASAAGTHSFQRIEDAEGALAGRSWELRMVDPEVDPEVDPLLDPPFEGDGILAAATLPLVPRSRPLGYFSDGAGCPRSRFEVGEPIHLTLYGPAVSSQVRAFLVPDRPVWTLQGPSLTDLRGLSSGSLLQDGPGPDVHLLWDGPDTWPGYFAAVLRVPPGNESPELQVGDWVLGGGAVLQGGPETNEEGLVIEDWGGRGAECQ